MGLDEKGLGFIIRNAANAQMAFQFLRILLKLRAEGGILNIVDCPLESLFPIHSHPPTPSPKV